MVELLKKEDYRFNSREPFFPCCIKAQKFILFPVGRSTVNIFFNPLSSCMCNSFRLSFLHFAITCKLHSKYMQIQRMESHEVVRSFRQQIFVCLIKLKKDMTTGQSTGIRGLSHNSVCRYVGSFCVLQTLHVHVSVSRLTRSGRTVSRS